MVQSNRKETKQRSCAGYGLEILGTHTFTGYEKTIEWIKTKTQEEVKFTKTLS